MEADFSWAWRPITSRMRASTSAGPAVSSSTSSTPQSAETAVRPPSVSTRTSGTFTPVVFRILHSDLALARSCRASTKIRSEAGALISDAGSAGIDRVRWLSSPSAGRTSPSTAEVRINSCATGSSKTPTAQCIDRFRSLLSVGWPAAVRSPHGLVAAQRDPRVGGRARRRRRGRGVRSARLGRRLAHLAADRARRLRCSSPCAIQLALQRKEGLVDTDDGQPRRRARDLRGGQRHPGFCSEPRHRLDA